MLKVHISHEKTNVQNGNENNREEHHIVTIENVTDDDEFPSQQTSNVQVYVTEPHGYSNIYAIQLHPDQSDIQCDDNQIHTIL